MASFSVTITSNIAPAISITLSGNTTYSQLKNSLGNFVYNVNQIYAYSTNIRQISNLFRYSKYDSSGNQTLQSVITAISPYQYQPSIYVDTSNKNLIIDGRDYVRFSMLPNCSLTFKLYADRVSNQDSLNETDINNFKQLEIQGVGINFFKEYIDYV